MTESITPFSVYEIRRNEKGYFLAPNGEISHYQEPRIQKFIRETEFLEWFGDWVAQSGEVSQACHGNTREPILFTHRSKVAIKPNELSVQFDKTFGTEYGPQRKSLYFSTGYLPEFGKEIYQGFLNIKKPSFSWSVSDENDGCIVSYKDGSEIGYHAAIFVDNQFYPFGN